MTDDGIRDLVIGTPIGEWRATLGLSTEDGVLRGVVRDELARRAKAGRLPNCAVTRHRGAGGGR